MAFISQELFTQEVVGGVFTMAAVFFGARLALKSYRTNQWWDSRHKTYQKVVETLEQLKDDLLRYKICLRDIGNSGVLTAEKKVARDKSNLAYLKTTLDLQRQVRLGRFNMSDPARKVLLDLRASDALPSSDGPAMLLLESKLENATKDFCQAAHLDLQILTMWQRARIVGATVKRLASNHIPHAADRLHRFALILCHGLEKGKVRYSNFWEARLKQRASIESSYPSRARP